MPVETRPVTTAPPAGRTALPHTRVIAAAIAATIGLIAGFQLARLTATPTPTSDAAAPIPSHTHPAQAAGTTVDVGGVAVSASGYTLVADRTAFVAQAKDSLRFRVVGQGGTPVTTFAVVQEQRLHLVIASRDLGGFQHLHPTLGADGTWSTPLTLGAPGPWRAIADFTVQGADGAQTALTLGIDLTVSGSYAPAALPAPAREYAVNGYVVTFEGTPIPSSTVRLVFRVFRDGSPIVALEPYLGTLGHLVVLREGDVGYVHVHADTPTSAGEITFWLTTPSAGRYRMFLDFKLGGAVQTAEFTVVVP